MECGNMFNLPVSVNATSELFLVLLLKHFYNALSLFTVCVLDVVCRAFYKQSMVQSEVRKLCVHPTWFIYSEDFTVNEFDEMKLNLFYLFFTCVA